nr:hypothetical protein [Oscillospiraceae bacterium]
MKSRTSFFNKTLLLKNITRFAPLWGIYLLCLLIGLGLMYMEADNRIVNFWFASNMATCIQVMGLVNLFFAPLTAMLLFGDLFHSRMCNALHAMPVRRETLFLTNVVSGLIFSLVPTAVMALLSVPLLAATVVHNAWQIAILWYIGANLEFVCFFGIAVFCIFCAGNRLGFAALYAVLNGGAFLVYAIVDMLYTPMLYGVVTPDNLVETLTPIAQMLDDTFVEVANYQDMLILFEGRMGEAVADFWVDENYYSLFVFALVGIAFMALGLVLYRKRNLECAGDAVAVRWLAPVFQVIAAVVGIAGAVLCLEMFFYSLMRKHDMILYGLAFCGMVVGWFAGKMLLERSTRVFRPKNWIGLGVMAAIFAVSLTMTHFDVFGIETWTPRADKVASVDIGYGSIELTEKEDIAKVIRLQEMALEDRLEDYGRYPARYIDSLPSVSYVTMPEGGFDYGDEEREGEYDYNEPHYETDHVVITYRMDSGREVTRRYYIWASFEEGRIIREFLSRWDNVWRDARMGYEDEIDFSRVQDFDVDGVRVPKELMTEETVLSLIDAIKADCEAQTMAPNSIYHTGYFRYELDDPYDQIDEEYGYNNSVSIRIDTYTGPGKEITGAYFRIFADSENTLKWLQDRNLLERFQLVEAIEY